MKHLRLLTALSLLCVFVLPANGSTKTAVSTAKNDTVESLVTSSPPGATVTYTAFGKSRIIGKTPFKWSFLRADIYRSSMIPTLTFELAGHETATMALDDSKTVHVTLKTQKRK